MENTTDTFDSDEDMEYLDMLQKEPYVGLVLALEMSRYRQGVLIPRTWLFSSGTCSAWPFLRYTHTPGSLEELCLYYHEDAMQYAH